MNFINQFKCFLAILFISTQVQGLRNNFDVKEGRYIGCYKDQDLKKLFENKKETFTENVTPQRCIDLCIESGLPYAAIHKGNECYCSVSYPPDEISLTDELCNISCSGNASASCGGALKLSVYQTGISNVGSIPAKVYLGCFKDDNQEFRLLKEGQTIPQNTPAACHAFCYNRGARYSGTTYMKECWCGDARPSTDVLMDEEECNSICTGDSNQKCGGGWRMSIYATGVTDIPTEGRFVGCYTNTEDDQVFVSVHNFQYKKFNSARRCLNICDQLGTKYSGVQNGGDCYCSNALPPDTSRDVEKSCNVIKCPGEATDTCGAKTKIKIFKTRHTDEENTAAVEYLGCFKDQSENRICGGSLEAFPEILTRGLCVETCKQRGYFYAATQFGKECYCGYNRPTALAKAPESECNTRCEGNSADVCGGPLRSSIYTTTNKDLSPLPSSVYLGCYKDDNKDNRLLQGSMQDIENNTPESCQKLCYKAGFFYSGVTWITGCFCGDTKPSDSLLMDEVECTKQCGGDSNKKCGGGWRLGVFSTGLTGIPAANKYVGCFQNLEGSNFLSNFIIELISTNSPIKCVNICEQAGYKYAGLERGIECRCGNEAPPESVKDNDKDGCNTPCPSSTEETCGKKNRINVYRTRNEEITTPAPGASIDVKSGTNSSDCEFTNTLTGNNNARACKGQVVFNEAFTSLDNTVWTHTIKMAAKPDYEFVTYTDSPNVSYVKDGKLYIKPMLQKSDVFLKGSLTLPKCTGKGGSLECARTAQGSYILPPVLSARLSTKDSFVFRYGVVNIRAKLPIGDWMIPEIWLMPKNNFYGEDYASGQIRIAFARGNLDLKCGKHDASNKRLEMGVYVGTNNAVKKKTTIKTVGEGWAKYTHEFTLTWTPDNLMFSVDAQPAVSLLKKSTDRVTSVTGQPKNAVPIWKDGDKLAPFDKNFYISFGVSVGGIRDFPDNSTTSKGAKKPWGNTKPQAMYTFYQGHTEWEKTWLDEQRSALQIESVKVTAL